MTSNVTSIARIRTAARARAERAKSNNRTTTVLLLVAMVLVVIGLGETMSASSTVGIDQAADRFYFFKRQLIGVGLGLVALVVASRVPYSFYRRVALPLFALTIVGLIAVLMMGTEEGGARRWLVLGPVNFQPSELAKFAVIALLAALLERKARNLQTWGHLVVPVGFVVGTVAVLLMKQPDLGTTILIGLVAMAVLWVSPAPGHRVILMGLMGAIAAALLAVAADYRMDRIVGFLDPWSNASAEGYQLIQGYYALGDGGIFGVGLGASRARWFYLPNAHTDFIFAIIGEETGLIGAMTVIGLFGALAVAGWAVASRAPDLFGKMLATGITAWISFQALINIGGVLGVLPITGIALPFVSFGSTALVASMGALGVLVNISQQGGRG
ncbi:MAG TPA: putative lipid II flippase FtsW [Acidimicrobiia bacterium]|jgi:cell division protein FtsW